MSTLESATKDFLFVACRVDNFDRAKTLFFEKILSSEWISNNELGIHDNLKSEKVHAQLRQLDDHIKNSSGLQPLLDAWTKTPKVVTQALHQSLT